MGQDPVQRKSKPGNKTVDWKLEGLRALVHEEKLIRTKWKPLINKAEAKDMVTEHSK